VTLPALVLATYVVGSMRVSQTVAWLSVLLTAAALSWAARSQLRELHRVLRESFPVLLVAGLLNIVAGITFEKRLDAFAALPALLVLVPGFLSSAGSLGSILSAQLATRLHLGLTEPRALPDRGARSVIVAVLVLSLPTFVLTALAVEVGAALAGMSGPAVIELVGVASFGGCITMLLVVPVAYYGAVAAVRVGLDPDTYGIPLVTSMLDLVGAFALVSAILALGLT
jgi:mgtE-like transporter